MTNGVSLHLHQCVLLIKMAFRCRGIQNHCKSKRELLRITEETYRPICSNLTEAVSLMRNIIICFRSRQVGIIKSQTQQSYCQSWSLRRATSRKENFDCIFFLHKNIDEAIFRWFTLLIESSVAEWRAHRTPQQFGGPRLDSPARTVRLHGQICFSAVLSPFNLSL